MRPKPRHESIRQKFERKIDRNKDTNKLRVRGGFLDINYLKEILTREEIKILLREDFPTMDNEALDDWCVVIHDHRRKSYAILILEEMADSIDQLDKDDRALDDEALFNEPFLSAEPYSFPWKPARPGVANVLQQKQWIVPPRLSSDFHQTFPAERFRFPFIQEPKMIDHGSFGAVKEVKIAEGHMDFPEGYDSNSPIVYKTVRREEHRGLGWPRLLNEVRTLRARKHPHIAPLLSSFAAGNAHAFTNSDTQENLYMILPKADGNMDDWMKSDPGHFEDLATRRDYIYDVMISVVSGVAYIHKEIKGTVGFHHDLKPANILRFPSSTAHMPVWKICDFGGSNLKDAVGETGTAFEIGTPQYAPLEFFNKDGSKHGRAYDMFSLGCILLELATIWKYGWSAEGLEKFTQLRFENGKRIASRHPKAYYDNKPIVDAWVHQLKEDDSRKFCNVVELIEETLVERYKRLFAWELEIDLRWTTNPKTPPNEIVDRLRDIAQPSRKPNNAISNFHNPLMRAKRMRRPDEFLAILKSKGWSDNDPGSTEILQNRSQPQRVSKYFSTLVVPQGSSPLYGRHEENERIEKQFASTNILGLFGLGGIGKSHLALHYALQFQETDVANAKKHTFWVNAGSKSSILDSYIDIAEEIGLSSHKLPPELLCKAVKNWLEDYTHGPWIMVIDGLDSLKAARALKDFLPRHDTGQLLVTARNRESICTACGWDTPCWEVQKPQPQDCLKIFRHHLVDSYYDEDVQGTGELLDRLWLPLVIKMAAIHMNKLQISNRKMCDTIDQSGFAFDHIKEFDPNVNFMRLFLKPLFELSDDPTSPGKSDGWPYELRLLCFLACLNKDKVGIKLIKANYSESDHAAVDTRLARLVNCAYIENVGDDTYRMHKFVQDSLIAWIRDQKKEIGLFQRFESALAALLKRYEEKKRNEHRDRAALIHRSSYAWKTPFMPHFARFVEFTYRARDRGLPSSFKFREKAIDAIDAFSQFYLEQGRPQAAIEVLEFAQNHRNGGLKSEVRLGRKLAQAYVSRALAGQHAERRQDWRKGAMLLKTLIQKADEANHSLLKWELVLELVRLYGQSGQCGKAWEQLGLMGIFKFRIRKGHAELVKRQALIETFPQWEDAGMEKKLHMLIIRVRYEEGLVHLAAGDNHLENGKRRCAFRSWKLAKQAFLDSMHALEEWLPEESEFLIQIEGSIADANSGIGTEELLSEAEDMLKRHIIQLRDDFEVSDKRIWDTEYRLAAVCLKGNEVKVQEAIQVLERLTKSHSDLFGKRHGDTAKCASLLWKACMKAGLESKARELENTYDLDMRPIDEQLRRDQKGKHLYDFNQLAVVVAIMVITIVIPVYIALGIFFFRKGKS